MNVSSVLCFTALIGFGAYVVYYNTIWRQNQKRAALSEWQRAGFDVVSDLATVLCYSNLSPYSDRRQGIGVLCVAKDNVLFRSARGQNVVIPFADIRMIAVGNMWRRTIGKGKFGPHVIVDYDMPAGRETLAFHTRANRRLGNEIERHSQFICQSIPRGYRVWQGRLIRPR